MPIFNTANVDAFENYWYLLVSHYGGWYLPHIIIFCVCVCVCVCELPMQDGANIRNVF